MELKLIRTYYPDGTNGMLYGSQLICHTIELPWLENTRGISCIPEGRYALHKRFTKKHQHHLMVMDVPGRSGILLHPANDALKELRGCIAPVTTVTAAGMGIHSRLATEKLNTMVFAALERSEKVYLTIKTKSKQL